MVELSVIRDLVAIFGVIAGFSYYVLTVQINQRNQKISMKNQELMLKAQEQSARAQQLTLETRQAQMYMNIYQQTTTKDFSSAYSIYISNEWKNYDEFMELIQKKEFSNAFSIVAMYWEGLGVLVKEGFLPIRLVALLLTGGTRSFWEKLMLIKDEARTKLGYVRWMSETEYLYNELLRYIGEHPELATEYRNPPKQKS